MPKINKRNLQSVLARGKMFTHAYRTNKKIVVIESDDWGGIRTSNRAAYDELANKDYQLSRSAYSLDCLESNEDLEALFHCLERFQFNNGQHPKITGNVILGNPDFKAIRASNFEDYSYESVDRTLQHYPKSSAILSLWKDGKNKNVFTPQLHGREHIKYWEWMKDLKNGSPEAKFTFDLGMCGVPLKVSKENQSYFKPLYTCNSELTKNQVKLDSLIHQGGELFEQFLGYTSRSTVAPNVAWTDTCEYLWKQQGIQFIQGGFLQEMHCYGKVKYRIHYTGEKNKLQQIYLVRNCTFEPVKSEDPEYWKSTFASIERAFKAKTPAIISSHRVNYVGSIKESNRDWGLTQLSLLLRAIQSKYPDTIFMSSDELGLNILK